MRISTGAAGKHGVGRDSLWTALPMLPVFLVFLVFPVFPAFPAEISIPFFDQNAFFTPSSNVRPSGFAINGS